ncbi:MAG TPA: hypothetical protein VOA87_14110, partial [Thermoanaerobaculia bacterium]|nr:hypothetical protein [Thermoanaerobaculia bacterium]
EDNLTEMGLSVDTLPLVLQFNKRDLADICTVEEMNQTLNPRGWPHFEASALTGQGVFETLKGVSKLTLLSLKKRLTRSGPEASPGRAASPAPRPAAAPLAAPKPAAPPPPSAIPPAAPPSPAPVLEAKASPAAESAGAPAAVPQPPSAAPAIPATAPATPPAPSAPPPSAATAFQKATPARGRSVDVLGELEKLRREAMQPAPAPHSAAPAVGARAGRNGRGELSRNIELTLKRADFARARRFLVSFQVEDDQNRVMDSVRDLPVEIKDAASLEKLLLRLNIALHAKE